MAETNSTCTLRPAPEELVPKAGPARSTSPRTLTHMPGETTRLMNPGPAMSMRSKTTERASRRSLMIAAMSRGARFARDARTMAAFEAKSPNSLFAGTLRPRLSMSWAGIVPSCMSA